MTNSDLPLYIALYDGPHDGGCVEHTNKGPIIIPIEPTDNEDGTFSTKKFARYDPIDKYGYGEMSVDGSVIPCRFQQYNFAYYIDSNDLVPVEGEDETA